MYLKSLVKEPSVADDEHKLQESEVEGGEWSFANGGCKKEETYQLPLRGELWGTIKELTEDFRELNVCGVLGLSSLFAISINSNKHLYRTTVLQSDWGDHRCYTA